ncbi:hypothetical protein [Streptomonospora salina]|uniref:Uncharacterized protein n=1 Tax=Streptomonospora salina TaxID=104205 RepID=A0A841E1W6_9ACTN|nr:hypothetical protein [Streptomonospora salina]MBB5996454.1 hypothetical protein [Streptomonospora salina]
MTGALTATEPAAIGWELARLRRTYRPHGWTVWHGKATGQYWAAHTRAMVLLCGESEADLAAAINRFVPIPHPPVPAPRRPSLNLPRRPRPRRA